MISHRSPGVGGASPGGRRGRRRRAARRRTRRSDFDVSGASSPAAAPARAPPRGACGRQRRPRDGRTSSPARLLSPPGVPGASSRHPPPVWRIADKGERPRSRALAAGGRAGGAGGAASSWARLPADRELPAAASSSAPGRAPCERPRRRRGSRRARWGTPRTPGS